MDQDIPVQRIGVDEYTRLTDALSPLAEEMLGAEAIVLPSGGADMLIDLLTCIRCGTVVCPRHDRQVRQRGQEDMVKVPLSAHEWTPFFPKRIIDMVASKLQVVVD